MAGSRVGGVKQKDQEFKASLGYIARYFKNTRTVPSGTMYDFSTLVDSSQLTSAVTSVCTQQCHLLSEVTSLHLFTQMLIVLS